MSRIEVRELNRLGHRLVFWDGPAGAPVLVALHGYLDLGWSFDPFVEALQRRIPVSVVAPDLRGHGATEWVGRGGYYHFADYVADVAALVDSLGRPEKLHLLGHSMGGTVAALLAGSFPERFASVVLVEGLGPPAIEHDPPARMARWIEEVKQIRERPVRTMPDVATAALRLRENNPRMSESLARLLAEEGTRPHEGGRAWSFDPLHRTRSPSVFVPDQFRSFLARIACPVLLVEGGQSELPALIEPARAAALRDARRVVVPDAGHMVHQDQPERLAEVVAPFLSG